MAKTIRPSKNGGVSICESPEEKIGKGRCHHILSEENTVVLNYRKEENCYYVDLKNEESTLTVKAKEKLIKDFFTDLKESVDEETKMKIIDFLDK